MANTHKEDVEDKETVDEASEHATGYDKTQAKKG